MGHALFLNQKNPPGETPLRGGATGPPFTQEVSRRNSWWKYRPHQERAKLLILLARSERFELPALGIEILRDSSVINGLIGSCCIRVALGCDLDGASVKRKP